MKRGRICNVFYLVALLYCFIPDNLFAQGLPGQDTIDNPRIVAWVHYKELTGTYTTQLQRYDSCQFSYPNVSTKEFSSFMHYYFNPSAYAAYSIKFSYLSSGEVLQDEFMQYQILSNTWVNKNQTNYTYNSNRKLTQVIYKFWPLSGIAWENYSKTEKVYDASNNLVKEVSYYWVNGNWSVSVQIFYTNNMQGKPTVTLRQDWRRSTWVDVYRYDMSYDAGGKNLVRYIDNYFDTINASWRIGSKIEYSRNNNGQISQQINTNWDTSTRNWATVDNRITYTYDIAGNLGEELRQYKELPTGNFYKNANKNSYTYNTHNQVLTQGYFVAVNNVFTQKPNSDSTRYYYNEAPTNTAIHTLQNGGALLAVYPNPAANELHVSLKWNEPQAFSATLTDMAGRVFTSVTVPPVANYETTLGTEHLPSGNYLLTIRGNNGDGAVQKVMVKH